MVLACQAEQPADQMKPNLLFLSQLVLGNSPVTVVWRERLELYLELMTVEFELPTHASCLCLKDLSEPKFIYALPLGEPSDTKYAQSYSSRCRKYPVRKEQRVL